MAGFQMIMYGRFWVITEGLLDPEPPKLLGLVNDFNGNRLQLTVSGHLTRFHQHALLYVMTNCFTALPFSSMTANLLFFFSSSLATA